MQRHPWELDAEARHRIATITAGHHFPAASRATRSSAPWTRVRRGLGHGLVAAGYRLAGDAPATSNAPVAIAGRPA